MVNRLVIHLTILLILPVSLRAETWVQGALTLHEVANEVAFSNLGDRAIAVDAAQLPVTMPGLVDFQASYGASAFLSTSNRSYIYFSGDGSLAVERFEQRLPDRVGWESNTQETGQSRMIMNFRAGNLVMDSRRLLDASQCLIETPLGRVTVKRALWQMQIVFDPRSEIFDFTITCGDGRVRFTDQQGLQYTLRTGQRLSGAGARMTPSIEVGKRTVRTLEQMKSFSELVLKYGEAANELGSYLPHLRVIEEGRRGVSTSDAGRKSPTRRPIVIEYANEPDPITPFRGELRPPSSHQADLF